MFVSELKMMFILNTLKVRNSPVNGSPKTSPTLPGPRRVIIPPPVPPRTSPHPSPHTSPRTSRTCNRRQLPPTPPSDDEDSDGVPKMMAPPIPGNMAPPIYGNHGNVPSISVPGQSPSEQATPPQMTSASQVTRSLSVDDVALRSSPVSSPTAETEAGKKIYNKHFNIDSLYIY